MKEKIAETIIENVPNVWLLIDRGIITEEEVRELLGLKPKTHQKTKVDNNVPKKED